MLPAFVDFRRDRPRGFRRGPENGVRGFSPIDGQLTPCLAEQAIQRLPDIGAVIVVGPFGMGVDVDDWLCFRSRTGIPVILDAAAGFDTAALSPIPTIVSLHATKALGCGEGGFVMSSDKRLISRIMARSNFGFISRRKRCCLGRTRR